MAVLKELGLLPVWQRRVRPTIAAAPDWDALAADLAACAADARLGAGGVAVPGSGSREARLLVLLAAPDQPQALLTGAAGRLFDNMLKAIGLRRETIWLTCVARWPTSAADWPAAAAAGDGFWRRETAWVAPAVVLALGETTAAWLADRDGLGRPVVAIPAPRDLLETPAAKAQAWRGLKQVAALLADQLPVV